MLFGFKLFGDVNSPIKRPHLCQISADQDWHTQPTPYCFIYRAPRTTIYIRPVLPFFDALLMSLGRSFSPSTHILFLFPCLSFLLLLFLFVSAVNKMEIVWLPARLLRRFFSLPFYITRVSGYIYIRHRRITVARPLPFLHVLHLVPILNKVL